MSNQKEVVQVKDTNSTKSFQNSNGGEFSENLMNSSLMQKKQKKHSSLFANAPVQRTAISGDDFYNNYVGASSRQGEDNRKDVLRGTINQHNQEIASLKQGTGGTKHTETMAAGEKKRKKQIVKGEKAADFETDTKYSEAAEKVQEADRADKIQRDSDIKSVKGEYAKENKEKITEKKRALFVDKFNPKEYKKYLENPCLTIKFGYFENQLESHSEEATEALIKNDSKTQEKISAINSRERSSETQGAIAEQGVLEKEIEAEYEEKISEIRGEYLLDLKQKQKDAIAQANTAQKWNKQKRDEEKGGLGLLKSVFHKTSHKDAIYNTLKDDLKEDITIIESSINKIKKDSNFYEKFPEAIASAQSQKSITAGNYQQAKQQDEKASKEPVQKRSKSESLPTSTPPLQKAQNSTGIPENLKSGMESLSGMSLDHVKVHYNSNKPATVQAHAFAQGSNIYLAPGQEKHLPHELGHVVQQARGEVKPTTDLGGVAINDNPSLESSATKMGNQALQLKSFTDSPSETNSCNSDETIQRVSVTGEEFRAYASNQKAADKEDTEEAKAAYKAINIQNGVIYNLYLALEAGNMKDVAGYKKHFDEKTLIAIERCEAARDKKGRTEERKAFYNEMIRDLVTDKMEMDDAFKGFSVDKSTIFRTKCMKRQFAKEKDSHNINYKTIEPVGKFAVFKGAISRLLENKYVKLTANIFGALAKLVKGALMIAAAVMAFVVITLITGISSLVSGVIDIILSVIQYNKDVDTEKAATEEEKKAAQAEGPWEIILSTLSGVFGSISNLDYLGIITSFATGAAKMANEFQKSSSGKSDGFLDDIKAKIAEYANGAKDYLMEMKESLSPSEYDKDPSKRMTDSEKQALEQMKGEINSKKT